MKRVVIDTSIWIRILLAGPITQPVLEAWKAGRFRVVFSELLLAELEEVSGRPRLRGRIPHDRAHQLLRQLRFRGEQVTPTTTPPRCRDPKDEPLDRHYQSALELNAEVVVKIPSDCPLIDPDAIDRVLGFFLADPGRYDYVSNLHPGTWPDGNDVEVVPLPVLAQAWQEAERPFEREHTTPFLWERPERFRLGNVSWETGPDLSRSHRFTIDYPEDYDFVAAVYEALWQAERPVFGLAQILELLRVRPGLRALNARWAGVNWYRHHLSELRTVGPHETRFAEESP